MSSKARSSRSRRTVNTPATVPPESPALSAPSRSNRPWVPPTTNADKERLQHAYDSLYDSVTTLKDAVVAADRSAQREAGIAFDAGLVRLLLLSCLTLQ